MWRRKKAPLEIPESPGIPITDDEADLDDDAVYEYEEPERGPFDHPHRIRPVAVMEADDVTHPITATAFLAYREKTGGEARDRAEFGLSMFECIPDEDEDGKPYTKGVEPKKAAARKRAPRKAAPKK